MNPNEQAIDYSDRDQNVGANSEEDDKANARSVPEHKGVLSPALLTDFQVKQTQLEIQNKQLIATQKSLETARGRYLDLYDSAPVGYFTVNEAGVILEANLTVAKLLDVERDAMETMPFTRFILAEDQHKFVQLLHQAIAVADSPQNSAPPLCELRILRNDDSRCWTKLIATKSPFEDDSTTIRVVLTDISERRKAESAQRDSEQRYRAIFEQAAVGFARLSTDGCWLDVNQRLCEIVGYSREELLTKTFQDITFPDDLVPDLEYVRQLLSGEIKTYALEKRYRRKDGVIVWVNLTVSLVRELNGAPGYFISVVEDISQRKRAQSIMDWQTKVLQMIARGQPASETLAFLVRKIEETETGMFCSVLRLDEDGKHLRHCATYRLPESYARAIDGGAIGPVAGSCGTAVYRRGRVIVEDIASDPLWVNYRELALSHGLRACWSMPICDEDGRVLGTFANYYSEPCRPTAEQLHNIEQATNLAAIALSSQRKQESLRVSDLALKAVSQGVLITGPDGLIVSANSSFTAITGYGEAECLGLDCEFIQGPLTDPITVEAMRTAIRTESHFSGEILNYRKDGATFWNDLTISPVRDSLGQLTHFIGVVRDTTARKQATIDLQRSEIRYRQLFECNPNPMWVYDLETLEFLAVNTAAIEHYGYSHREFLSMTIHDIRPDEDQERLAISLRRQTPNFDRSGIWRHRRKDGSIIDVEITSHKLEFSGRNAEMVLAHDITLRRQAERSLKESEARYRAIVQQAPLGIAEGELEGDHFLSLNQRYAEILGYSVAELMELTFRDFTHPEDLERDLDEMRKLAAGEIPFFALEKRYIRKDGAIVWVHLTVAALGPPGNKPTACLAVIDDITARKNSESALSQSEKRYRAIIEAEPECVKVVSAAGELLEMNPAGLAMLEATHIRDIQSHGLLKFILPPYQAAFGALHQSAIEGKGGLLEFEVVGLQGTRRWLETHTAPLPDADGHITKMLGITRDITDRKVAAQALQQKEQRLSFVLNNTPAVIYTSRVSGDYGATYITDNVRTQLGYEPAQFMEDAWFWVNAIHPDDVTRVLADMAQLFEKGQHTHEYRFRHADGTYRWMHDESQLLLDEEGNPSEIIGSWIDITGRKQAEKRVRRLNAELEQRVLERTSQLEAANKELEAFSYSVSHDLRAPLRGIDGYVRILQEDYGDRLDAEGHRLISVVSNEAKRMGRLIDDLLSFSRMGRQLLDNNPIDMTAVAKATMDDLLNANPARTVRFELHSLPPALGDLAMIRQVFVNLIGNAFKFSRQRLNPVVEVGFIDNAGEITYYIRDNGAGFDSRYGHKLFGVFQRLHTEKEYEGTGIGLALVQRIIHRHGGRVRAEGKLDSGATFYFTLPTQVKVKP